MPAKAIMVDGGALAFSASSAITGGSFTISSTPSQTVSAGGGGVYSGPLAFTFTGADATGFTTGTVAGNGTISPTTASVLANGSAVVRVGDQTTAVIASGTQESSGSTVTVPGGAVEVADAGQTSVLAGD